jgi:hypothetical protein
MRNLIPLLAKIENNHILVEINGDYETHGLEDLRAVRKMFARRGYELFLV